MRLHCGQKCSSTGTLALQLRHSGGVSERTVSGCAVMVSINGGGVRPSGLGAEGTTAPARLLRVGVVEHEAFAQQGRVVVERRAVEKQIALLVDEDLGAVPLEHLVAEARLFLPRERVAEARAAAAFDAHTKPTFRDALLGHQGLDLLRGDIGDFDHGSQWATHRGPYMDHGPPEGGPHIGSYLKPSAGPRAARLRSSRPAFSCSRQSPP